MSEMDACFQYGGIPPRKKTFLRWKQEILQSFMHPFNNGYIEGINNTIKVLKRDSFGIKNFQRLKHKILWQQEVKKALV